MVQTLLDPIAGRLEDDHLTREPLDHLLAAGFAIERVERAKLGSSSASPRGSEAEPVLPGTVACAPSEL